MARCTPRAPGHRDDTQGPTAVNTRPVRLPSWTARAPGKRGRRQHSGPTLPQPWRMSLGSHRPLRAQNVSGLLHKQEASLPHLQHAAPAGRTTCTPRTPARLRPHRCRKRVHANPEGPRGGGGGAAPPSHTAVPIESARDQRRAPCAALRQPLTPGPQQVPVTCSAAQAEPRGRQLGPKEQMPGGFPRTQTGLGEGRRRAHGPARAHAHSSSASRKPTSPGRPKGEDARVRPGQRASPLSPASPAVSPQGGERV